MVMPWQNTAMVSIRWHYLYIVLLRFDAVGTHSTCVEVWQQLDEHSIIHESTIGQVCQFANTLGFGTQVFWVVAHSWRFHVVDGLPKHDKTSWLFRRGFKSLISIALLARVHKSPLHKVVASGLSCISQKLSTVRTCVKWWVLHSIKQMARYRLVNGIHVMKSFPNAAQVVNSMSWFQPTEVSSTPQTKARLPAHAWHNMLLVWVYLTSHCVIAHVQRYEVSQ